VRTAGAEVDAGDPTSRGEVAARITSIAPNPAVRGARTRIDFTLPRSATVRLDIFDARGARVRRLDAPVMPAGAASLGWDGRDTRGRATPAGLYFVTLRVEGKVDHARFVRLP
jgi:hypothetical protein